MAVLPISRNVRVSITRQNRFATRRGFGVPLLLTSATVAGVLDQNKPIFYAASIDEVAAHWNAGDAPYDAALAAFSQNPRPLQIAFGWYESSTAVSGNDLTDALQNIQDYDTGWYWIDVEPELRDTDALDGVVAWVEAQTKFAILTSNDLKLKDSADTTNIAARHKGTVERTAVFYHPTATLYPGFALAAKLGTYNFDNANSAYTAKYKHLAGITPINIMSDEARALDGFVPAIGQNSATGHLANIYIDQGGINQVEQGSTLKPNVFIDEIHSGDWMVARCEEEILNILRNNNVVKMDDTGMQMLAGGPRIVMQQAIRAGLIASDVDPETGDYQPNYVIDVPSVFDIPASQRKNRIAPPITVYFRASGAVHYAQADIIVSY
jgi:hypothetical protein